MSQVDYLIVGQGLAGTLIAHLLQKAGRRIQVIDSGYPRAASLVAAGIIHPVTGRRYVKSWRIDELLPVAERTYRELETLLGLSIYHPRSVLRALFNAREENDWQVRAIDPAYQPYILSSEKVDIGPYATHTKPVFAYGEVVRGAQVDIGRLVLAYRQRLLDQGLLIAAPFDHDQLELSAEGVRYGRWGARRIIFCEGALVRHNPYFNHLPFEGNKGETLRVEIPAADFSKILKHRIFVVPLSEGGYWIGSTSDNYFEHDAPTPQGRQHLTRRLEDLLLLPYQVIDHRAAIRPTVKDRRPMLGIHPEHPSLVLFNGLGTKGASLGPFFAKHLIEVLEEQAVPDPAVDLRRFYRKSTK